MESRLYIWNVEKNAFLKATRGIGFEDIVTAIRDGRLLLDAENPSSNFPEQRIFIVEIDGYAIVAPYVSSGKEIFLKTLYPDRKARKLFLKPNPEKES